MEIKCSFCGNTFYAHPKDAICPKCERPANRDLPFLWRVLSLLLPPLGIAHALWIRPHSPFAAIQGFKHSLGGALIFLAVAMLRAFWA